MKVAFWSNVRGISGSTCHLACISIWHAMMDPMARGVIIENHKSVTGIDKMLYKHGNSDGSPYYRSGGLGNLLRRIADGEHPTMLDMDWMAERYIGERLMYFPIGADLGPEQLSYHLENNLDDMFKCLEKRTQILWMDLMTSAPTTRMILNRADRVIISLPQNRTAIEQIFGNHKEIRKKAFYIMGNYDEDSDMTVGRIIDEYGIDEDRIAILPHYTMLMDSVSRGVLIPFVMRLFHCTGDDVMYPFALDMEIMVKKVLGFIGSEVQEVGAYERVQESRKALLVANRSDDHYSESGFHTARRGRAYLLG